MTIAYRRFEARPAEVTSPTRAIKVNNTGSWKAMPKPSSKVITSDRYSFTLASRTMGRPPSSPVGDSKLTKKRQAIGITTKYASAAPIANSTGVAKR